MQQHQKRIEEIEKEFEKIFEHAQIKKILIDQEIIKEHTIESVNLLKEIRAEIKEMHATQEAYSKEINASIVTATKTALSLLVTAILVLLGVGGFWFINNIFY